MLLAVDVGNTNIVLGVFDAERLVADYRLHTDDRATGDELGVLTTDLLARSGIAPADVHAVVVGNVVPTLQRAVDRVARGYFDREPMVLGPGLRTGIRIRVDDPREVGADRIANAVAARHLYGVPAVLVDFGTATTFDAIGAEGEYLGGAIAPGIQISHDALVRNAALLRRVELVAPPAAIGRNTTTSMQAGIVFGYVGLVEGLVTRFRAELGGTSRVIATGGIAEQLAPLIACIDVVDERLTLTGLRLIYEQNR
ncbi:MAG TPA: type III pantothenate kinase [Candidatus Dormibacteraeota bacterium]